MSRRSLTPKERQERLDAAHERLATAVRSLQSSSEWVTYLRVMARFTRYSASNALLIYSQRPEATQVAGFRTWRRFGRTVRKGTKGIAIIAPCTYKIDPAEVDADDSTPAEPLESRGRSVVMGFKTVVVFDIADTKGKELPGREVQPLLLDGEAPEGMWDYLLERVTEVDFSLVVAGEIPGHPSANGITNFGTRTVTLATAGRSPASQCRTLAHELAHMLLHADVNGDLAVKEVEAESVAFLVADAFGLDGSAYTVPYIANWGINDPDAVLRTAARVMEATRTILAKRANLDGASEGEGR